MKTRQPFLGNHLLDQQPGQIFRASGRTIGV
jgi:hypothetical protein